VGDDGKMAYSTDGANWTAVSNSTFPATYTGGGTTYSYYINAIAYGNNRFVAGGERGRMAYSANGTTWTAVSDSKFPSTNSVGYSSYISDIAYGNNRFVAVGDDGKMVYSTNGANWTAVSNSTFPATYTGGGTTYSYYIKQQVCRRGY